MSEDNKNPNNVPPSLNISSMIKKADEIYEGLKNEIEPAKNGKFIAIEVDSGTYFIAETREEAVNEIKKLYPDKIPLTRRIGELERASRHISRLRYKHVV